MSLVSRHLEENGIPTVIIGAARDIVEHCGVARFLFTDFPLGNPCGEPEKVDMQRAIFTGALDLLESRAQRQVGRPLSAQEMEERLCAVELVLGCRSRRARGQLADWLEQEFERRSDPDWQSALLDFFGQQS